MLRVEAARSSDWMKADVAMAPDEVKTPIREACRMFAYLAKEHVKVAAAQQALSTAFKQGLGMHQHRRFEMNEKADNLEMIGSSLRNTWSNLYKSMAKVHESNLDKAHKRQSPFNAVTNHSEAVLRVARCLYALPVLGRDTTMYLPLIVSDNSLVGDVSKLVVSSREHFGEWSRLDGAGCG